MLSSKDMINLKSIQLVKVAEVKDVGLCNTIDLTVADDESFTLASGVISHNSASKAVVSGRDPATMGSLALRGKPQNANSVSVKKLLGLDTEKKTETEFFNIMAAMGLQMGVPVEAEKDGEWVLIEHNGEEMLVNINDEVDGVNIRELTKPS